MKRPDFMQGVPAPVEGDPKASAPRIRNVSWQPAGKEPALPDLRMPVAAMPPPSPPREGAFEALPSAPMPSAPLPPPPAAPQINRAEELAKQAAQEAQRAAIKLAIEKLRTEGEWLAEQARSDSLELAVLIARRILEKEISTDLGAIFALIKSAIRRAGEEHVTQVRVHPDDLAALQGSERSEFSFGKITLVADTSLTRGDVMVDTEHHSIDGRLGTRLDELVKHLEGGQG